MTSERDKYQGGAPYISPDDVKDNPLFEMFSQESTQNKEREAFENIADAKGYGVERHEEDNDPSRYVSKNTQAMWEFFCEGRAVQAARQDWPSEDEVKNG